MRVVAGSAGGRRLVTPPGRDTRPTTDRVREAVFNALGSLGAVVDARVLDLYAGSGALGVEALSRGAAHATFVDRDRAARQAVTTNLAACGLSESADVVDATADQHLARPSGAAPYDLVLLDPPYGSVDWADLLARLAPSLAGAAVVVAESDAEVEPPDGWEVTRSRRYGSTVVTFLRPPRDPRPAEPT